MRGVFLTLFSKSRYANKSPSKWQLGTVQGTEELAQVVRGLGGGAKQE